MTRFDPNHESLAFDSLKDAVVVLTGGASGIGAATVRELHSRGARVIFGDLDEKAAESVISSTSADSVHFLKTDVRSYQDTLALFKLAASKYGRVDHALPIAGVGETAGWFDPTISIADLEKEPDTFTWDINLKGVVYFSHIACTYMAQSGSGNNKSLTLISSLAGFKETPRIVAYQTTKHGVLGVVRSLRNYLPSAFPGVRVNALLPSLTDTKLVTRIRDGWIKAGNPVNTAEDIAKTMVGVMAAGPGTKAIWYDEKEAPGVKQRESMGQMDWDDKNGKGMSGRGLYVIGGEVYDIEESLDRTERLWLGDSVSSLTRKAQSALGG